MLDFPDEDKVVARLMPADASAHEMSDRAREQRHAATADAARDAAEAIVVSGGEALSDDTLIDRQHVDGKPFGSKKLGHRQSAAHHRQNGTVS